MRPVDDNKKMEIIKSCILWMRFMRPVDDKEKIMHPVG